MTRQERAIELNELIRRDDGLGEILEIYSRECEHLEADDTFPPHSLMIDAILNAEFPARPRGILARA